MSDRGQHACLFLAEEPSPTPTAALGTHSPRWTRELFPPLAGVTRAAVGVRVQVSVWTPVRGGLGLFPGVGLLPLVGVSR